MKANLMNKVKIFLSHVSHHEKLLIM